MTRRYRLAAAVLTIALGAAIGDPSYDNAMQHDVCGQDAAQYRTTDDMQACELDWGHAEFIGNV